MDISGLTSATGQNFNDPAVANRVTGKQQLDADDFLKLLSVQLQSQDPLKPMEDTQFISQMASFTSLEQMRTLTEDFQNFTAGQRVVTAQNFLGKIVTVTSKEGDVTGEVSSVTIKDGEPKLIIGKAEYDASAVINVRPKPTTTTDPMPAQTMLGTGPAAVSTPAPLPQTNLGTAPAAPVVTQ